jgi:hypothetical protein
MLTLEVGRFPGGTILRRSTFLAAATATALSATLFAGLAPAHADNTTGGPVLSDADGWYEPGLVFVTAHSDRPLTHITAHFYPLDAPAGGPEAGSTEDFTQYTGQDATSGVWRAPVHLADLGDYRVTVDLEDASGATVTGALSPHTLRYQTLVRIPELTATPAVPDYLHQQVTVSGTAVATDPRHPDTPTPAAGVPVDIETGRGRVNATTTADGRFTAAFVPVQTSVDLTAAPGASVNYPGAIDLLSPKQSLHTTQAPVRFTASTHALNLKQGATGTVTGRAEIQTTAGWQPLPNTTISLRATQATGPSFVAGETTTDSHGSYTLHVSSYNAAPTAQLMAAPTTCPSSSCHRTLQPPRRLHHPHRDERGAHRRPRPSRSPATSTTKTHARTGPPSPPSPCSTPRTARAAGRTPPPSPSRSATTSPSSRRCSPTPSPHRTPTPTGVPSSTATPTWRPAPPSPFTWSATPPASPASTPQRTRSARVAAGGRTPLDGAVRGGTLVVNHGVAARALIRQNVTRQHDQAPRNTIAHGLVMRRSRVRIPKAALWKNSLAVTWGFCFYRCVRNDSMRSAGA